MIRDYLNIDLVWLKKEYQNRDQLFFDCAQKLLKNGFVDDEYYHALSAREDEFPTGLDMEEYAVAIPHTNSDVIKKDFIVAMTLKKPIKINKMDDATTAVDCQTFFLLGLKDSNNHLIVLREFINMIQDKGVVNLIQNALTPEVVLDVIEEYCNKNN